LSGPAGGEHQSWHTREPGSGKFLAHPRADPPRGALEPSTAAELDRSGQAVVLARTAAVAPPLLVADVRGLRVELALGQTAEVVALEEDERPSVGQEAAAAGLYTEDGPKFCGRDA